MSYWTLLQATFDLFIFAIVGVIFWRIRRPPQDDPRLSRGLQLLQTKITVLEDLSDRTEAQVKQLTGLIDQKTRALQNKVIEAEQQIIKIDHTMDKGGAMMQESLPPEEMAERHRTIAYVRAARMANAGFSVDQIAQKVSMPREQLELIAKFNREQLMFDETQLPDWANSAGREPEFGMGDIDFVGNLDKPRHDFQNLARLENEFKQTVQQVRRADEAATQSLMETKMAETIRASINSGMETMQPAVMAVKATAQTLKDKIVATAEEMLRQQEAAAAAAAAKTPRAVSTPTAQPLSAASATYMPSPAMPDTSFVVTQPMATQTVNSTLSKPLSTPQSITTTAFNIGTASPVIRDDKATVKKVIFPRIEKPT